MINKILKRKDAYSVVVAIVLGFSIIGPITTIGNYLIRYVPGMKDSMYGQASQSFKDTYIAPLVVLLIEVLLLEVFLRVVVFASSKINR